MDTLSCFQKAAFLRQLSFSSPAKINLFFRVLYKREDGFHEIASLYQAIDLCDTLKVSFSEKDLFTCSDPLLSMDENNLVIKALRLFREKTGFSRPLSIDLKKNIPMQAGLGGGSSNAATALFAFCKLFELEISHQELSEWGAFLGSDVPFFFSSGSCYCTGRGEKLEEVSSFALPSIWIAKPLEGLSTPLVYSRCHPSSFLPRDPLKSLSSILSENFLFYNDLEEAAFSLSPSLKNLKKTLLEIGFDQVILCGSGTSFFCIGSVEPVALEGVQFFQVRAIRKQGLDWYR